MASTYSTGLRIELQTTGENSGTWGTITNNNFSQVFEFAIAGVYANFLELFPLLISYNFQLHKKLTDFITTLQGALTSLQD